MSATHPPHHPPQTLRVVVVQAGSLKQPIFSTNLQLSKCFYKDLERIMLSHTTELNTFILKLQITKLKMRKRLIMFMIPLCRSWITLLYCKTLEQTLLHVTNKEALSLIQKLH